MLIDTVSFNTLIDSGSDLFVINKQAIPQQKSFLPQIILIGSFKDEKNADLAKFIILLEDIEPVDIKAVDCLSTFTRCY